MDNKAVKFIIIIAVVIVLAPFVMRLLPEPITFERAKAAFEAAGLNVSEYHVVDVPQLDAVGQASLLIGSINVQIYRYDNEGKIATQYGYQQQDPGTAIVETWGLAESLGAKPAREKPTFQAARNGKFMLVASGYDKATIKKIINIFNQL